jgi:hypothetical protein
MGLRPRNVWQPPGCRLRGSPSSVFLSHRMVPQQCRCLVPRSARARGCRYAWTAPWRTLPAPLQTVSAAAVGRTCTRTFHFLLANKQDGRLRDRRFDGLLGLGHGAHERRAPHGHIVTVSRGSAVGARGAASGASEQVRRMDRAGFPGVLLLVEVGEHAETRQSIQMGRLGLTDRFAACTSTLSARDSSL